MFAEKGEVESQKMEEEVYQEERNGEVCSVELNEVQK